MAGMNFIILKINGTDVSQMPHEEAVQMFLKAPEPIVVEVRRRAANDEPQTKTPPSPIDLTNLENLKISSSQSAISLCSDNVGGCHSDTDNPATTVVQVCRNSCNNNNNNNNNNNEEPTVMASQLQPPVSTLSSQSSQSSSSKMLVSTSSVDDNSPTRKAPPPPPNCASPITSTSSSSLVVSPKRRSNSKIYISTGVQTDTFTTDYIFNGSSIVDSDHIENEHNLFEECLAPEIDIEEVTLRKSASNERLGLTVSYSSGGGNGSGSDDTDTCTEVYISDIIPDSIAAKDGRLRQGDQILQVNGRDVSNKEETESLIAENKNAVTLLVSRCLYTDEDFNDPVEYYDEDEHNLTYQNYHIEHCVVENHILSDNKTNTSSTKSSSVSNNSSSHHDKDIQKEHVFPSSKRLTHSKSADLITNDPLNHLNIKAHLESVNQEIAMLDSRVQNMMLHGKQGCQPADASALENLNNVYRVPVDNMRNELPPSMTAAADDNVVPTALSQKFKFATSAPRVIDSDTEHIYETIPEDSESEPVYCSPYENSEQNQLVEQWLDMQHNPTDAAKLRRRQQQLQLQKPPPKHVWQQQKNASNHSSAGDDHENSSSAYNTGGSCHSTNAPLTLELNSKDPHLRSTLVLCPPKHSYPVVMTPGQQHRQLPAYPPEMVDNCRQCHRQKKEKTSPKHCQKILQFITGSANSPQEQQSSRNDGTRAKTSPSQIPTDTMYTNVENLQQTMLLQQKLFRQALSAQQQQAIQPQFNAPNLSQYHFVSGQEVTTTTTIKPYPNDEQMVWKVKRRQDGTRYIVRRPAARNRMLRDRAMKITEERNELTTEDDTISEIKTGRYWTKEERKKHIERAKERRQRQQMVITNKTNMNCAPSAGKEMHAMHQHPGYQPSVQQNAASQVKLARQHSVNGRIVSAADVAAPNASHFTTLHRKSTSKRPNKLDPSAVELGPPSVANNAATTPVSKHTTTPNGNKMVGLLSVTTV